MKNVTITLDEELARWARIEAARQTKSLSRLIAELLEQERKAAEPDAGVAWMKRFQEIMPPRKWKYKGRFNREALYDRKVLRRH